MERFQIGVREVEIEGEKWFEAVVAELPDLAEYAKTEEEARELAIDSIHTTLRVLAEKGRPL